LHHASLFYMFKLGASNFFPNKSKILWVWKNLPTQCEGVHNLRMEKIYFFGIKFEIYQSIRLKLNLLTKKFRIVRIWFLFCCWWVRLSSILSNQNSRRSSWPEYDRGKTSMLQTKSSSRSKGHVSIIHDEARIWK